MKTLKKGIRRKREKMERAGVTDASTIALCRNFFVNLSTFVSNVAICLFKTQNKTNKMLPFIYNVTRTFD